MRDRLDSARDAAPHGTFTAGLADPGTYGDDARPGRFSDGQAPPAADLEPGRFSAGMEALGDDDPKKHAAGSFADEDAA
jgi:hypothetical protein